MSKKDNWFVIANEETAIVWKDGEAIIMPKPALEDFAKMREVFPVGSKKGYRTFGPGHNKLSFKVASDGPVLLHTEMPEEMKKSLISILADHCKTVQDQLEILIDTALKPKQRK